MFCREKKFSLPLHVKKFMPEYIWIKILSKSIEAFKKTPETIIKAIKILETLIDGKNFSQNSQGRWYNELALIKMYYQKNFEDSAVLILHALKQDVLTEVDVLNLMKKLKLLMKKKIRISEKTRTFIQEKIVKNILSFEGIAVKTISANLANR
jgi:hypothetical protein